MLLKEKWFLDVLLFIYKCGHGCFYAQMARNILGECMDKGKKIITYYKDMKAKCICLQFDDTERKGRKS